MKNVLLGLIRQSGVALLALVALTVVVGGLYPVAVWGISRFHTTAAEGSFQSDVHGCRSSDLLGVDQRPAPGQPDPFLHNRVAGGVDDPMAPGDPAASGASNLGPNSPELVQIIDARRSKPENDLITALVQAEVDGERLTDDDISYFFTLLCVAGSDAPMHTITHTIRALSAHPDQRAYLLEDLDGRIDTAVEEFVRWATPAMTFAT